ncbi:hypothetical protein OE88DRAFT_1649032 [Heliocybe sulcata]|uniref:Amidohydrolase-related domain-containing protein n=1 Tax=Heliocybe sulcata TaxID=5364 RepID=A0A5C3MPC2_9AGAM|nr:hypothetical protein OE88DRAFT_1649032 [Heliocybe sulcata]
MSTRDKSQAVFKVESTDYSASDSWTTTLVDHFSLAHIEKAIQVSVESGVRTMFCLSRIPVNPSLFPFEFSDREARDTQMQMFRVLAAKDSGRLSPDGRVTLGFAHGLQGYYGEAEDDRILSEVRRPGITPVMAHNSGGPTGMGGTYKETELGMSRGNPVVYEGMRWGVKAGLGTDNVAASSEMFTAVHLVLQSERGRIHETLHAQGKVLLHNDLPAASVFRLATLGGAGAAYVAFEVGSLKVGKLADVILYDPDSADVAGCSDPFRGIAIHATGADVTMIIIHGETVKKDGKLLRKEWREVREQLQHHRRMLEQSISALKTWTAGRYSLWCKIMIMSGVTSLKLSRARKYYSSKYIYQGKGSAVPLELTRMARDLYQHFGIKNNLYVQHLYRTLLAHYMVQILTSLDIESISAAEPSDNERDSNLAGY